MSEYFPKPKSLGTNVKVELDLSNYATKADLKIAIDFYTSDFAKKTDFPNMKFDLHKLDNYKFKNATSNSSNLESKVNKLSANTLIPVTVDISKLREILVVKKRLI